MENVPRNLLDFSDNEDGQELDNSSDSMEEIDNPLHSYSFDSQEISFIPYSVTSEEVGIAPGEGKTLVSIFNYSFCEELAFPWLFLREKFGYKVERNLKLTPAKCFN